MSKNRIAAALCAAVMMGTSIPVMMPMAAFADETTEAATEAATKVRASSIQVVETGLIDGDYTYKVYGTRNLDDKTEILTRDYAEITKYSGTEQTVNIPAELGENKVPVKIISDAFKNNATMGTVTVPEGVTTIQNSAFASCKLLTTVNLPSTLTTLSQAFTSCKTLTDVNFAENTDGLETIGTAAFKGCTSLSEIQIPPAVQTIGSSAFYGTALVKVELPKFVRKIDGRAFESCTHLEEIVIDTELNEIGTYAFNGCTSLKTITIKSMDCKISATVFGSLKYTGTIQGQTGSTVEEFVKTYNSKQTEENQITFEALDAVKEYSLGDVDLSGRVDIMDVIIVNKYILGTKELTKQQLTLADVIGDKTEVDSADSLTILKYALDMIKEFPKSAATA